jgi:tetratricopeptide (TPR) repeat protein
MKCVQPDDGSLLTQYMLNLLNDEDRGRFEEHVMSCESCWQELSEADPKLCTIGVHRKQLLETLHQEGISFEGLREELLAPEKRTGILQEFLDDLTSAIGWLLHGKRWVPVAGMVVVALLLTLLPTNQRSGNPYLSMLSFEKYPYLESPTRTGMTASSTNPLFSKGIKAYNDGDYKKAAAILAQVTSETPNEWPGWFFLGVSYYLDQQAKPAIAALLVADSLNDYAMELEIKWYLSQAYLLDNDPDNALPYLRWLEDKPGEFSSKAKSLIKEIDEVEVK